MSAMFSDDLYNGEQPPRITRAARNVHVKLEKTKLEIGPSSVTVSGEYHFYNDAGREVDLPQPAKILKLNFKEDHETGNVCFSLTKEALIDIVNRLSKLPHVYSFDANSY